MSVFTVVTLADLHVTSGHIEQEADGALLIQTPEVRAQKRFGFAPAARVVFEYRGQTSKTVLSANGYLLEQFGLKLRALNTCNVLYIMWRFAPVEAIEVKLKRNPDDSQHSECKSNGYKLIQQWKLADFGFPSALDQRPHTLTATLSPVGNLLHLHVQADTVALPVITFNTTDQLSFDGPCGLRSDNALVRFRLFSVLE